MVQRKWKELEEFPGYVVSNLGEFANMRTDREIRPSRTRQGHAKISLYKDGRLVTRSVALLVAEAFVAKADDHFDTPIHLNGDLMDCAADNLMWRPRWFAIRFHRQFYLEAFHDDQRERINVKTGEHYASMKELCMREGLYYYDVDKSCYEETFVPITYQEFRVA
jgi:hypothetical protein